jgi:hypothetical protein
MVGYGAWPDGVGHGGACAGKICFVPGSFLSLSAS